MTSRHGISHSTADRVLSAGLALVGAGVLGVLAGCASPGPPHPPSLQIPGEVKGLTALRREGTVELRFMLPKSATDNQPLKTASVTAMVCRAVGSGPCKPAAATQTIAYQPGGSAAMVDALPQELTVGPPKLLAYRVRLLNPGHKDRFVEWSGPAYTAAGGTPPAVSGLTAQGSRLGIVLTWQTAGGDASKVMLTRVGVAPKRKDVGLKPAASPNAEAGSKAKAGEKTPRAKPVREGEAKRGPEVVLLDASTSAGGAATLDTNVLPEEPYEYSAERVLTVELGGHSVELRSSHSPVIAFTLHDTYPPPAPMDVSVAGFVQGESATATYQVDLIWQPVDDANLAGYVVYRQAVNAQGNAADESVRLTREPVALPAFHDTTADAKQAYRYSVTAVDRKGNESTAAMAMLSAQAQ